MNATLQNVTTNSVPPLIGKCVDLFEIKAFSIIDVILSNFADDKFTPPPFPSRDMSDYHSDEEKSDSSGDIFASCKRLLKQPKTSHTSVISGSNMSDNICDGNYYCDKKLNSYNLLYH